MLIPDTYTPNHESNTEQPPPEPASPSSESITKEAPTPLKSPAEQPEKQVPLHRSDRSTRKPDYLKDYVT